MNKRTKERTSERMNECPLPYTTNKFHPANANQPSRELANASFRGTVVVDKEEH